VVPTSPHDSNTRNEPAERLGLLGLDEMSEHQRRLATGLINGPRKGVVGPFIPLLYTPQLLEVIEPLGSELRFRGELDRRVHELVVCLVAATAKNQFEWDVHSQSARDLGVAANQLEALHERFMPSDVHPQETAALEFVQQLLTSSYVDDDVFSRAVEFLGSSGVVELTAVAGYFTMVCWLINVTQSTPTWK
jgi:4-carboxymuconolactone decarboxylase